MPEINLPKHRKNLFKGRIHTRDLTRKNNSSNYTGEKVRNNIYTDTPDETREYKAKCNNSK